MDPIFGPLVNLHDVPSSVEEVLRDHMDAYLAAVERDRGLPVGEAAGGYSRPQTWRKINLLESIPGEDMSPALFIITRGANAKPEVTGRKISVPLDIGIALVTTSFEGDGAREVAGSLGAAVIGIMLHRRNVDGKLDGRLRVESWDDVRLDDVPGEESRTRAILRLEFTVRVSDVVEYGKGYEGDAPVDPYPPPANWPTALTHEINVRKEDTT